MKDTAPTELICAVRTVAAGDSLLLPCHTRPLADVSRILAKLQARDRAQLVITAYGSGLIRPVGTRADKAPH